jgi:hypothetical protein
MATYNVGGTVCKAGFFTNALYLRGQTSAEIERRIGYHPGRLAQGWYLLFLLQLPTPQQFEYRGYSYMSGGIVQGHLANPPDRRTAEQRLADDGFPLAQGKQGTIDRLFRLDGAQRLAKVTPVRGEFGRDDYPAASGIPQWTLTVPLPFRVAAHVAPGQMYQGHYT